MYGSIYLSSQAASQPPSQPPNQPASHPPTQPATATQSTQSTHRPIHPSTHPHINRPTHPPTHPPTTHPPTYILHIHVPIHPPLLRSSRRETLHPLSQDAGRSLPCVGRIHGKELLLGKGFACKDSRSGRTWSRAHPVRLGSSCIACSLVLFAVFARRVSRTQDQPRDLAHLELARTPAERMVSRALLVALLLPVCSAITWATRTLIGSSLLRGVFLSLYSGCIWDGFLCLPCVQ